jgi:hypothetical protein
MTFHLAQVNIARAKAAMDTPVMADFVAALDRVNAMADDSPGFVWRLQSDTGNATDIVAFDDPLIIINMSLWETIDDLFEFTYRSSHSAIMAQRRNWFDKLDSPHMALWWVPAGTIPDVLQAREKLDLLARLGPTSAAFTFKQRYDPAGVELARAKAEIS